VVDALSDLDDRSTFGRHAAELEQRNAVPHRLRFMLTRLLAILLCLGLGLQAVAAPTFQPAPCPMEEQMQAALAAGDALTGELPDCCQDLQSYATTGKACKAQLDCGFTVAILGAEPVGAGTPGASAPLLASGPSLRPAPVGGPWRPPAQR